MTKKKVNFSNLITKYNDEALPFDAKNILKKLTFNKYSILDQTQFIEALRLCSKGVSVEIAVEAAGGTPNSIELYQMYVEHAPKDSPNLIQYQMLNTMYKQSLAHLVASVYDCSLQAKEAKNRIAAAKLILELEEKIKKRYAELKTDGGVTV